MIILPDLKIEFIIFLLNFIIVNHGLLYKSKWINNLVKHIQKDWKIAQAVFIIDDNFANKNIKLEIILGKVQSNNPSQVISLQNATLSRTSILKKDEIS